jgi:predicted RNA-binding protein
MQAKVKPLPDISEPVPFKSLVPALSFIKNKVMWSGSIRAMRTIPEEDYQRIIVAGEGN